MSNEIGVELYCRECGQEDRHSRTIKFFPGNSTIPLIITFSIPDDRDDEEYVDEYLEGLLSDFLQYNCDWEFV